VPLFDTARASALLKEIAETDAAPGKAISDAIGR
jgi:hypothetical protein